jgi:hypothetical protein
MPTDIEKRTLDFLQNNINDFKVKIQNTQKTQEITKLQAKNEIESFRLKSATKTIENLRQAIILNKERFAEKEKQLKEQISVGKVEQNKIVASNMLLNKSQSNLNNHNNYLREIIKSNNDKDKLKLLKEYKGSSNDTTDKDKIIELNQKLANKAFYFKTRSKQ